MNAYVLSCLLLYGPKNLQKRPLFISSKIWRVYHNSGLGGALFSPLCSPPLHCRIPCDQLRFLNYQTSISHIDFDSFTHVICQKIHVAQLHSNYSGNTLFPLWSHHTVWNVSQMLDFFLYSLLSMPIPPNLPCPQDTCMRAINPAKSTWISERRMFENEYIRFQLITLEGIISCCTATQIWNHFKPCTFQLTSYLFPSVETYVLKKD